MARVSERRQQRYNAKYDKSTILKIVRAVARRQEKLIPRSVHQYVTRVSKRRQQHYSAKYDKSTILKIVRAVARRQEKLIPR
ncbi:hypothetical protein, partial [Providencia huaxiensis]|uniref:hypothetical protein n=1 Tax=Providencia huaxiensis TaxID=2027290 RepID=UPI00288111E6|nr:hypothetical protein [Providencia huaxiensis]